MWHHTAQSTPVRDPQQSRLVGRDLELLQLLLLPRPQLVPRSLLRGSKAGG